LVFFQKEYARFRRSCDVQGRFLRLKEVGGILSAGGRARAVFARNGGKYEDNVNKRCQYEKKATRSTNGKSGKWERSRILMPCILAKNSANSGYTSGKDW